MSTFGSLLVQDQIVDVVEIERALQRQVIYGGDLATNLLELRLVDEALLTEYAARAYRIEIMPWELAEKPELEALKAVPWELVNIHRALPVKIEDERIFMAVSSPFPNRALREISHVVGLEPTPRFILGFRLEMSLNRFYGLPLSPRFGELRQRLAPDFEPDQPPLIPKPRKAGLEVESESASGDDETARIYTLSRPQEPLPERIGSEITLLKVPRKITDDGVTTRATEKVGRSTGETAAAPETSKAFKRSSPEMTTRTTPLDGLTTGESAPGPMPDIEEYRARVDGSDNRDDIIDAAIDYLSQVFKFIVLFVVSKGVAKVRTALLKGDPLSRLKDTEISLEEGGIFKTVHETKSFHIGPMATTERDQAILEKLGRPWPKSCAVFPILLKRRVVLMVWGDSGGLGVRVDQGYELSRFAHITGDALERIVLIKKMGAAEKIPSPGPLESFQRAMSSVPPREEPPPVQEQADSGSEESKKKESMSEWAGRYHLVGDDEESEEKRVSVDNVTGVVKNRISAIPKPPREDDKEAKSSKTDLPDKKRERRDTQGLANLGERIDSGSLESSPGGESGRITDENIRRTADYGDSPVMIKDALEAAARHAEGEQQTDGEPDVQEQAQQTEAVKPQRSVVVEMKEEVERLVERILAPGRFDETAADLLLGIGDDALRGLIEKFPGPLTCDRYQEAGKLRRVGQHGPLLKTLLKFGQKAVPHLLPLLDSRDSDVRFYAAFMFSELHFPEAVSKIVTRLFDSDRQTRAITIDILKGFSQYTEYRWAMREVVEMLTSHKSSLEQKRIGVESLGVLGERSAVPVLAELLDSADNQLKEMSRQALVKIAFDDLGYSGQRWKDWWEKHKEEHRIEWAIASVAHPKEPIRNASKKELKQLTGEVVEGFNKPMDHNQRLDFQKRLVKWWVREGQALYPLLEG